MIIGTENERKMSKNMEEKGKRKFCSKNPTH